MAELLDLLMRGGPWTLVLAAGATIRFLFVEMRRRDLEHAEQTQALNDRIVASVEKQIPLLQASNEQSRKLAEALTRMEEEHR